ncbi:MAG: acyltransferase [Rikenellaceae bacterium]
MKDKRTLYEKSVQDRSSIRYILGLLVRWKQNLKYERARRIARKNGATVGDHVTMPITLAKRLNKNVVIGDHVSILTNNITSFRYPITIGSHVIIGGNVRIVMGGHNIDSEEWENMRPNPGLTIDDYVWLAPDSVILSSCQQIGYGAVVGANAIVTKDIAEMSVVVGFPAKEIRKRKVIHSNIIVESLTGGDLEAYIKTRRSVK